MQSPQLRAPLVRLGAPEGLDGREGLGGAADDGSLLALALRPAPEGAPGPPAVPAVPPGRAEDATAAVRVGPATGRPGEVVPVAPDLLLVGVGGGSPAALRRAAASLARAARGRTRVRTDLAADADDDAVRAVVEGVVLGARRFAALSGQPQPGELPDRDRPPQEVVLLGVPPERQRAVDLGTSAARATWRARDLTDEPASTKDPAWFAARAVELGAEAGLDVRVLDEVALAERGFGGILGVGQGSARPPRLVEVAYSPVAGPTGRAGARAPHVVLVGKGITFDTGGLTLKTREGMRWMKADMGGAAAVLAATCALPDVGCPVRVTALLPLAENMPSGSAQRPGDVLRQYDGTTVEVLNPDAEGRLVLADAIGYAVARLAPDAVVDVATLTGAVSVALGRRLAAVLSPSDALASALTAAGDAAGEPLWRLPLVEDYRSALDSAIADLANVATERVSAGVIVAALFLQRFARDVPWAHLDISGAAKAEGTVDEVTRGATGWGARTLLRWLGSDDPLAGVVAAR